MHDNWHDFMKNYEFWCTKKCPGKVFISEFIYEIMENHKFISYEFMRKHIKIAFFHRSVWLIG